MKTKLKVITLLHGSEIEFITIPDVLRNLIEKSILPKYIIGVTMKCRKTTTEISGCTFDVMEIDFELD